VSAPRIDAHQHFWRLARGDYGWLGPDLGPLYRDFEPDDLAPLLARCGIDATVAVQAAPSTAETRHLLALARATPWIAGVVGWVDFESRHALLQLAELAAEPKLVGIRPMIQEQADERWMLRPALRPVFDALERGGLAFDALVRPQHLGPLCELVERHPALRVVVDHGAKPALREGAGWAGRARWRERLRALASAGAYVKLSGLATEAHAGAGAAELAPWVDALLEDFGPRRVLWGSDWPVLLLASDYERWREQSLELVRGLAPAEQERVLGGNAREFYRLEAA
jgi:L-fuconolactonase